MDDADKRESGASEQKPPKIKAEDNPWYFLATLYGVPELSDDELQAKNRAAWNRYCAAKLDEEARTKLIEEKRHPAEELTPFSLDELRKVATAFAERSKASAKKPALPASYADIDFSNVEFEHDAFLIRCLFSGKAFFTGATFFGRANFGGATFFGEAYFEGATFSGGTYFRGAAFSGAAQFGGATFSGWAQFGGAAFSGGADFGGANFSCRADFDGAVFYGAAYFRTATFGEKSSFVNAEMKDETSFEGAIFEKEPPRFLGAKLHQGTVWRGIDWPTPKKTDKPGPFIDAQSRRVMLGPWWGWPIFLYGVLSGYGRSYFRPLIALFVIAAIGAGAFWYFRCAHLRGSPGPKRREYVECLRLPQGFWFGN